MSGDAPGPKALSLLEWVTAAALVAVVGSVAWMVLVAYEPDWLRLPSPEMEVAAVLALLTAALLLVSLVALLHAPAGAADDKGAGRRD